MFPYSLYKKGETDRAIEFIESLGHYIFGEKNYTGDPFWINSSIDYFAGLTIYLFENASKEEINLSSIFALSTDLGSNKDKETTYSDVLINSLDKTSNSYINLSGTLTAPKETRGSIISVFNQKIKGFISRDKLSKMISSSDFEIENIGNEKTAIFIISGSSGYSDNLIPMLVSQICYSIDFYGKKDKTVNILLDEFGSLLPIKNFAKTIDNARSINIRFTVLIKSYIDLINVYGKENAEILKMCFSNTIYLMANDSNTIQEIFELCGNQLVDSKVIPLITPAEIKTLKTFEAIVLIQRIMPIKTKLLPDYQIKWNFTVKEKEMPLIISQSVSIFDVKKRL